MIIIHNDSNQLNQSLGANGHYPPINDSYIYTCIEEIVTKHHQHWQNIINRLQ